jgi:archaeal type IV pilus assembly protein PilA
MKSFRRNLKGISPIFATLILIAIAVIAGVVVYMFTSGTLATMTSGGTAAQEKVSVQGASIQGGIVTVYAQSTNGVDVTVNSLILKDSSGTTLAVITPTSGAILSDGTLAKITSVTSVSTDVTVGQSYTITLITAKGGSFVSSSTIAAT